MPSNKKPRNEDELEEQLKEAHSALFELIKEGKIKGVTVRKDKKATV